MKKKLLVTIIVLTSIIIFHQAYWYLALGGNLTVWVNNQSEVGLIEGVEVFLDDKKIIEEDLKKGILEYKSFTFNISPGKHTLRVLNKSNNIIQEKVINSLLIKRCVIQFVNNYEDVNDIKKTSLNFKIENVFGRMIVQ